MSISRYQLRRRTFNANKMYRDIFIERGVTFIKHFRTGKLIYPTRSELKKIDMVQHVWTYGDRYEKLAQKYYGDPRVWWVIAWINKRPAELTNSVGDIIFIPKSLEGVLSLLNV